MTESIFHNRKIEKTMPLKKEILNVQNPLLSGGETDVLYMVTQDIQDTQDTATIVPQSLQDNIKLIDASKMKP